MTQPGTTPLAIRLPSAILSLVCLQLQTSGCWRTRRRPARLKMAKLGETLDMTGPPSEAFDRREAVVLSGETVEHGRRMLLPIIRTDAGGFFGFGEPGPRRRHQPGTLTTTSDGPAQADEADIQTAYLTREVLWLVQSNPYYEHTRATPSARRDLDRAFVCDCDYLDLSCTLFRGDCQSGCSRQKISRHVVWEVHR